MPSVEQQALAKFDEKQAIDPNKLLLSGYLYKKSSRYHHYKKRWFVLRNCQLSYYKDQSEHKPLGVIHGANLLSINADDSHSHHHSSKYYFKIHTNDKKFQMYANDESTFNQWLKGIKEVIDYHFNNVSQVPETDTPKLKTLLLPKPAAKIEPPPPLAHPENNTSSTELYSGVEDPNYTSNASDTNNMHHSSSALLPAISESRVDLHRVESERLKLQVKLLSREASQEELRTESDDKLLLDSILNPNYEHEIIIEKGQMSRLYKRLNQWNRFFIILTNKNMLFYKNHTGFFNRSLEDILSSETPSKIIKVNDLLDIVELEALSKSKPWCLLIITKKKRVRFSVETEEELVKWLVAITMLINRREDKTLVK